MPIVHHTIPTFTGCEVVAGVALDFKNGSAGVNELNAGAEAVVTAVKGWTVTHNDEAFIPLAKRPAAPADTDIHAAGDEPLIEVAPDIYDDVPIEDEA